MTASTSSATRVRYALLGVATANAFLLYLDRICMTTVVHSPSFFREMGLDDKHVGNVLSSFFFAYALGQLPAGWLADRFGRRTVVMAGLAACAVAAVPLLAILRDGDPTNDLFAELAFSVCIIATLPPYQVWLAERFPRDLRASGLGLAYNGAAGILGGLTPLLCTSLVELTGSPLAPAGYVAVACLVSLAMALRTPDTTAAPVR